MSQTFLEDIPEFLEIQRNSFLRILDQGLIQALEKINPISPTSQCDIGLLFYPKDYVLVLPENTVTESFLQGKTYGCKIYVPAIIYKSKKVKNTKLSKKEGWSDSLWSKGPRTSRGPLDQRQEGPLDMHSIKQGVNSVSSSFFGRENTGEKNKRIREVFLTLQNSQKSLQKKPSLNNLIVKDIRNIPQTILQKNLHFFKEFLLNKKNALWLVQRTRQKTQENLKFSGKKNPTLKGMTSGRTSFGPI